MWKSIAISLAGTLAAFTADWQKVEVAEPHMGTLFRIVVHTEDPITARAAIAKACRRVAELDQKLSDYKADSELNQLCRAPYNQPRRVSAELFYVLEVARRVSSQSSGAFDITIGPLVELWRQARTARQLPPADTIAAARARTGFRYIKLNRARREVTLLREEMRLDLGGIAKGYAADQALAVLIAAGFPKSLVAASGDIRVGDAPPGRTAWRVSLNPFGNGAIETVDLRNQAVSTSGASEQNVEIDGVRYSHILDPRSGLGLTGNHAVSVIAGQGILADAWATAFCVLGPKAAFKPSGLLLLFHTSR